METTRYVNHCSADNTSSADIYLLIPLTIDENYDYIVSDSMFVIYLGDDTKPNTDCQSISFE